MTARRGQILHNMLSLLRIYVVTGYYCMSMCRLINTYLTTNKCLHGNLLCKLILILFCFITDTKYCSVITPKQLKVCFNVKVILLSIGFA